MGVQKGHSYLKAIQRNIARDASHPKHHGIKMQAHHLLSQEGIEISELGSKIVRFGYEIDDLENLTVLPCTLQGACHLGVQPHRGDHASMSARIAPRRFPGRLSSSENIDEENYDDDDHPYSYHRMVARNLKTLVARLEKKCSGRPNTSHDFIEALHGLSQSILMTIYGRPSEARLTSIADHFRLGNKVGCGGVDNVGVHSAEAPCPTGRSHLGKQGPRQKPEAIRYSSTPPYIPRPRK